LVYLLEESIFAVVEVTSDVPSYFTIPVFVLKEVAFVPPLLIAIVVALQVPVVTVPSVVIEDCPTYDAEISITGVVPPVLVIRLVVPDTLVTPLPAGVAHVPSPRQNVVALADVPVFKFDTGRFPVTPFARETCAHAGLFDAPVFDRYLVALVSFASAE
jgi:hypothetical protein